MQLRDQKLNEKQQALEKAQEDLLKKQELLEQKLQELENKRPPRTKRFNLRRLILPWLSSVRNEGDATKGREGAILPNRVTPKRTTSYPTTAEHSHEHGRGTPKRPSLPTYTKSPSRHRPKTAEPQWSTCDEQGASSDRRRRSADLPAGQFQSFDLHFVSTLEYCPHFTSTPLSLPPRCFEGATPHDQRDHRAVPEEAWLYALPHKQRNECPHPLPDPGRQPAETCPIQYTEGDGPDHAQPEPLDFRPAIALSAAPATSW